MRNGFTFIRAFYVHAHDFNEFRTFIHQESTGKWWRNTYDEPRGFFAGEFPWRSDFPDSYTDAFKVEIGARKVKNIPAPRIILHFNGKAFPQTPHKMPKWRHEPIERSLRVEVSILDIPFNGRSPLERPRGSLPSKQFCGSKGLWIGLPSWDMFDSSGRRVSITSHLGKVSNSDSATYADRSLVKEYLQTKSMKLVWVVFGERQMLTGAGGDAGYKQFTQCIGGTRER